MGCYLTCPKNLIKEKDDNKKLMFLEITDENFDEIENKKSIKKHLFHYVIMPFLDFHFQLIYEKITLPYQNNNLGLNNKLVEKEIGNEEEEDEEKDNINNDMNKNEEHNIDEKNNDNNKNEESNIEEINNDKNKNEENYNEIEIKQEKKILSVNDKILEQIKENRKFNKEMKKKTKENICMLILSYYLTLLEEDELKQDEKFMGIYSKNDIKYIDEYLKLLLLLKNILFQIL